MAMAAACGATRNLALGLLLAAPGRVAEGLPDAKINTH
jgi:hypothetical protein